MTKSKVPVTLLTPDNENIASNNVDDGASDDKATPSADNENASLAKPKSKPKSKSKPKNSPFCPPDKLKINKKTDHFFISINKRKGDVHSFVMLGIYDPKKNKVQRVLCRVGKWGDSGIDEPDYADSMTFICNALFFSNKSKLGDEGVWREGAELQPMSYQAYDISYEQYLEFVQILESIQTDKNTFGCYKPGIKENPQKTAQDHTTEQPQVEDSGSLSPSEPATLVSSEPQDENPDLVTLTYSIQRVFPSRDVRKVQESVNGLNIHNTCRHSAIRLVEEVQHAPVGSMVSSCFLWGLPYETYLDHGKPSENVPFYALPAPPTTFAHLDEIKLNVLKKLYTRMEEMLCLEPDSPDTQDKFATLRDKYLDLAGPKNDLSLDALLEDIHTWKVTNKSTLEVLREKYLWDYLPFFKRTSSTMKLVSELENDLETEIKFRTHG
ncbi:hypothetical protein Lste_1029 [Legionella steelei]|uniref:Uncharacterized protein n=1 Tax=Legionella steelei TaxID=947033 RepID=A0A0W0ZFB3_9GAMM|nr:hypothetical protein [Legionella steelei]KTD67871.1 hypothetical protein Lste_1029 [Legionella steelei]